MEENTIRQILHQRILNDNIIPQLYSAQKQSKNRLDIISECSSQQKPKNQESNKKNITSQNGRTSLLNKLSCDLDSMSKEQVLIMVPKTVKKKEDTFCLVHQKALDIICLKDQNVICASCAIFGHKGHYFKSLKQFQYQKLKYCQKIVQILSKKKDIKDKITNNRTKSMIKSKFSSKKQDMLKKIKQQYQVWRDALQQAQNSSIQSMNKHMSQIQKSVFQRFDIPLSLQRQYSDWHYNADKQMNIFQADNIDHQIKTMNYMKKPKSYDVHTNGELLVQKLQQIFDTAMSGFTKELDNLKTNFDKSFGGHIKKLPNGIILTSKDSFNQIIAQTLKRHQSNSYINHQLQIPVQDLLIQEEVKIPKLIQLDQKRQICTTNKKKNIDRNRLISMPNEVMTSSLVFTSKIHSPIQSPSKMRGLFSSHISSKTSIKTPRNMVSSVKLSTSSRTPRSQSQQKIDKIVDDMIRTHSNVLDLNDAQLGDIKLIRILQRLRCIKIRTAILSKNKLTDNFVQKMWSLMPHVQTINLSYNMITQKILNNMLTTRRLQKNKNLILFHNKIKPKQAKFKIQALHRLGVTIEV